MSEFLAPNSPGLTTRESELIRVGREGIASGNEEMLDAYFAKDFQFHGPTGDSTYPELKQLFRAWRTSFAPFSCERRFVVSHGDYVSARTTMSGTFVARLEDSVIGPLEPNGCKLVLELINLFRYDADGLLAEEWTQYDNASLLQQLGFTLTKS